MNLQYEYLRAEHVGQRRQEAQQQRLVHHVARTRRLTRRAERVADLARRCRPADVNPGWWRSLASALFRLPREV